jgi:hypothetical protein
MMKKEELNRFLKMIRQNIRFATKVRVYDILELKITRAIYKLD